MHVRNYAIFKNREQFDDTVCGEKKKGGKKGRGKGGRRRGESSTSAGL